MYVEHYRTSSKELKLQEIKINNVLEWEVIETAETEWPSPFNFALTQDGGLWFCVDYRELNSVIVCGSYHITWMEEFVYSLEMLLILLTWMQTADTGKVKLPGVMEIKLCFRDMLGCFNSSLCPFYWKMHLETFQSVNRAILSPIHWLYKFVHLNHVVKFSESAVAHINHMGCILMLLTDVRVPTGLNKCTFLLNIINHLGHITSCR